MKRVRFAKGANGARWNKGGASSSNPSLQKYRGRILERYSSKTDTDNELTQLAIDKLSSFSLGDKTNEEDSDFDARTIDTTFSAFSAATSCASFRGIEKHWSRVANDPLAKEICSMAAMLIDLAKEDGKNSKESNENSCDTNHSSSESIENDAERFVRLRQYGALVVFLVAEQSTAITLTASYYLLSLIISKVNPQILRNQFNEVVPSMRLALTNNFESSNVLLLKSVLTCFSEFILHQPMKVLVDLESDVELFVSYIHHSEPKVRKTTVRLLQIILSSSDVIIQEVCSKTSHPFAKFISNFLNNSILDELKNSTFRMRQLNLLQMVIFYLPPKLFKMSLETCLSISSGNDLALRKKSFKLIQNVFASEPEVELVNSQINGQLLSALEELRPQFFDEELVLNWLAVYDSALVNLSKLDACLYSSHLISFISFCVTTVFVSQMTKVVRTCGSMCEDALAKLPEGVRSYWRDTKLDKMSDVCKLCEIVNELTNFKYSDNFPVIFRIISRLYLSLGADFFDILQSSLVSICTLRTNEAVEYGVLRAPLHSAVVGFGADKFLECYPLKIFGNGDDDFLRSWVITLFQSSVKNSKLSIWQTQLYPIAKNAESNFDALYNKPAQLKPLQVLHAQIWALLPLFCRNCTDANDSFTPGFAQQLSQLIDAKSKCTAAIYDTILALLKSDNRENVEVILKFSRNYLNQLFNVYTNKDTSNFIRYRLLLVCSAFMKNLSQDEVRLYFEKVYQRTSVQHLPDETKKLLLNLLREMLPFMGTEEAANVLLKLLPELWKIKLCRKSILVLLKKFLLFVSEKNSENENIVFDCKPLLADFMPLLLTELDKGSTAPRRQAMKCLILCMEEKTFELSYLNDIIPRTVSSLRSEKGTMKRIAVKLLKASCNLFVRSSQLDKPEAVSKLVASLIENVKICCCDATLATVMALQYVMILYEDFITDIVYQQVLMLLSKYLTVAHKPMFFEPALSLLKIVISTFNDTQLSKYSEKIVNGLCEWNRATKLTYRFYLRAVLFRLTKKMGSDAVSSICPEDHQKLLASIRKQINKEKLLRQENKNKSSDDQPGDDDDDMISSYSRASKPETIADILKELESSDDEDASSKATSKRSLKSTQSVFINEGKGDIVDLSSQNASQYLSTKSVSKQEIKKAKVKKNELKFAPDGRLLILGDDGKFLGDEVDEEEPKRVNSNSLFTHASFSVSFRLLAKTKLIEQLPTR